MEVHSGRTESGLCTYTRGMNRGNGTLSSTGHGLSILVALLYIIMTEYHHAIPELYISESIVGERRSF